MTGLVEFNYPAFERAKAKLIECGFDAKSPTDSAVNDNGIAGSVPYYYYFHAGLKMMLECGAIAMLPGWMNSSGARKELLIAWECGLVPYLYLEGFKYPLRNMDETDVKQVLWR